MSKPSQTNTRVVTIEGLSDIEDFVRMGLSDEESDYVEGWIFLDLISQKAGTTPKIIIRYRKEAES